MKQYTRRDALAALGTAGAGTCLCGLGSGCATFSKVGATPPIDPAAYVVETGVLRIALPQVPTLSQIGGAVKIIDGRLPAPLIVARTGETDYSVVSLLCTHRNVEVEYRADEHQFRCASLGHSRFGEDGARRRGPARKPLARFVAAPDPNDPAHLLVTL